VAYDQSPVSDAYRTARIPDQDRTWLALGGQYKPTKSSSLDFGYAHLFVKNTSINNNQSASGAGTLVGTYSSSIDIISMQFGQTF
jgi:long-chain fatty acid transport protein